MLAILGAGVLVGLETYQSLAEKYHYVFEVLDKVILGIFILEILVKILSEGNRPLDYFKDPWNIFDFIIVVLCFLPINAQYIAVVRLVRILRVLKLVTALPRLQILIGALIKSIPSMYYVGIMLFLLFYIYAVMGVFLFGKNDPANFGTLQLSMLTLFQVVTLEGWADIFKTAYYGADPATYDPQFSSILVPSSMPLVATFYFITFILMGTMIMLNLFIGVIVSGMDEAKIENEKLGGVEENINPEANLQIELQKLISEMSQVKEKLESLDRKIR